MDVCICIRLFLRQNLFEGGSLHVLVLVALTEVKAPKNEPGRTDRLIIGRQVKTTILSARTTWLLGEESQPKPKPNGTPPRPAERPAETQPRAPTPPPEDWHGSSVSGLPAPMMPSGGE